MKTFPEELLQCVAHFFHWGSHQSVIVDKANNEPLPTSLRAFSMSSFSPSCKAWTTNIFSCTKRICFSSENSVISSERDFQCEKGTVFDLCLELDVLLPFLREISCSLHEHSLALFQPRRLHHQVRRFERRPRRSAHIGGDALFRSFLLLNETVYVTRVSGFERRSDGSLTGALLELFQGDARGGALVRWMVVWPTLRLVGCCNGREATRR